MAQPAPQTPLGRKFVTSSGSSPINIGSSSSLSTTLDELIDSSKHKSYDQHSLWVMESMTDITQPFWNPYDVDYRRNNRAVNKVLTIQSGKAASELISGSELKPTFVYLKQQLSYFKSIFAYSLQNDGDGLSVSRKKKGMKLLELSMEFNLSQGLDPHLKIGDHIRFRYDYVNERPLLEFGINF